MMEKEAKPREGGSSLLWGDLALEKKSDGEELNSTERSQDETS